jgi:3-oxoacyl-[acyl-carrier protein] reductase
MSDIPALSEQTALVTGGSRGIGKAIATRLAIAGVNVALTSRTLADAEAVAKEITAAGGRAFALALDVSDTESIQQAIAEVKERTGRLDILINNAGITRDTLLIRMKEEDWNAVISTNLTSVFTATKEAVKIMAKQRFGRIVNISSVVAFTGNPGQVNYSASKAGMIGLTKTVAREYAARGITVNAVAPGFIVTAMTDAVPDKIKEEMLKNIPAGALGTPEDVAEAVAYLTGPGAGYVTGQTIHVNGGMYM